MVFIAAAEATQGGEPLYPLNQLTSPKHSFFVLLFLKISFRQKGLLLFGKELPKYVAFKCQVWKEKMGKLRHKVVA